MTTVGMNYGVREGKTRPFEEKFTLVTGGLLRHMMKRHLSPAGQSLLAAISIFASMVIGLLILPPLEGLPEWQEALIDALVLIHVCAPAFFFFVFRPLTRYVMEREQAEEMVAALVFAPEENPNAAPEVSSRRPAEELVEARGITT